MTSPASCREDVLAGLVQLLNLYKYNVISLTRRAEVSRVKVCHDEHRHIDGLAESYLRASRGVEDSSLLLLLIDDKIPIRSPSGAYKFRIFYRSESDPNMKIIG